MLLLADSGSTKTEWKLIDKNYVIQTVYTDGFNPYYYGVDAIEKILREELIPQFPQQSVSKVIYYGSGCSTEANCAIVENALLAVFGSVEVHIYHDLLAAAHALLGRQPGIACILGTGSNSCSYDGVNIIENVPSLGYLLADEGSGVYIGKLFITAYLYGEVPLSIANKFEQAFGLSMDKILDEIYKNGKPSRFLSGFSKFIGDHIEHPYCQRIVAEAFDAFIGVQLSKYINYQTLPISFTGSVAFHFKDILIKRMANHGLQIKQICASPTQGLVDYYTTEN